MINIFIDSNIFISLKYNIFNGPLKSLERYNEKGIVQLYTNEIVHHEVIKHMNKDFFNAISIVKKAIEKSFALQVALKQEECTIIDELNYIPTNMEQSLNSFFKKAIELKNDSVVLDTILRQYFEIVPPFENNEKKKAEFPDAIIIDSIKHRANIDELLFVVTDDHGWKLSFPDKNEFNVQVVDKIHDMTTIIAQDLLDERILSSVQSELKDDLLNKVKQWLEDYDFSYIAYNIDESGMLECNEFDYAEINNLNLYFNGIDYVDSEDQSASLDFRAEASVELYFSYIDHSYETYDREDDVYYNTKYGNAIGKIKIRVPIEVSVSVSPITDDNNNVLDIIDYSFGDLEHDCEDIECCESVDYDDELFAQYNVCPECGEEISGENDGGNGFCSKCAPNH